jgi:hypothetical protein
MPQSSAKRRTAHQKRALATEIVEALQWLGGAAHRDVVFERVISRRRNAGKPADDGLKLDMMVAFDAFRERRGAEEPALFALPFGEGSLRWALADCNSVSRAWLAQTQAPGRRTGMGA